jgi:predicted phage-related endonuclease
MEVDPDFVNDLLKVGEEFWNNHIIPGISPEPDGSDAAEDTLKALYPVAEAGLEYDGGTELYDAWNELENAKADAKEAEDRRKAARTKVLSLIQNAEVGKVDGHPILTYKNNRPSIKLDEAQFKAENPDLWEKYAKTVPGARVLRAKS